MDSWAVRWLVQLVCWLVWWLGDWLVGCLDSLAGGWSGGWLVGGLWLVHWEGEKANMGNTVALNTNQQISTSHLHNMIISWNCCSICLCILHAYAFLDSLLTKNSLY